MAKSALPVSTASVTFRVQVYWPSATGLPLSSLPSQDTSRIEPSLERGTLSTRSTTMLEPVPWLISRVPADSGLVASNSGVHGPS